MKLNDFEKNIDPKILKRGINYFRDGLVVELEEKREGQWSAVVEGTENYIVEVVLKNDDIVSSYCDCPYDMGPVCKHEVAVYYELNNVLSEEPAGGKHRITRETEVENLLEGLQKNNLQKIIIDKALDDEKFYNYLKIHYGKNDECLNRAEYKKNIRASLRSISGRDGFIDYYRARESADLGFELLNDAQQLLGVGKIETAMNLAQAVADVFVHSLEYTDDSDGGQGMVIDGAFDILFKAAKNGLPDELRKKTFNYYLKESKKKIYDDYGSWQDLFIDLASLLSKTDSENKKILGIIDRVIDEETGREPFYRYKLEKFSKMKYRFLMETGSVEKAESFFESCISFPGFRRIKLEMLLKEKDYSGVIRLAVDGEKNDSRFAGLVSEWKEWRFKAYERSGDMGNVEKLAYEFLMNNKIKYFEQYKKSIPAEKWKSKYAALKKALYEKTNNHMATVLPDILVKEKEFSELLELIDNEPYSITSYQKYFLDSHPEDVYRLHMINIRESADQANNRKDYKAVCREIKDLLKIGGKKEAKILINEFKEKYKRRPAFLDELSRLKIK